MNAIICFLQPSPRLLMINGEKLFNHTHTHTKIVILTPHALNHEWYPFYLLLISSLFYSSQPLFQTSSSHASPPWSPLIWCFTEEINDFHTNFLNLTPSLQSCIHFYSTFLPPPPPPPPFSCWLLQDLVVSTSFFCHRTNLSPSTGFSLVHKHAQISQNIFKKLSLYPESSL